MVISCGLVFSQHNHISITPDFLCGRYASWQNKGRPPEVWSAPLQGLQPLPWGTALQSPHRRAQRALAPLLPPSVHRGRTEGIVAAPLCQSKREIFLKTSLWPPQSKREISVIRGPVSTPLPVCNIVPSGYLSARVRMW